MRFGSKNNEGAPATIGLESNPCVFEEADGLSGNNFGFMDTIARTATSDGGGVAGVDAKLVIDDGAADALSDKGIPEPANNGTDLGVVSSGKGAGD
jgi:hypothetical protein